MSGDGASNRLAEESSPYLLLHKSNPVDWYPWGEEALARARDEERPIFLSVGYSTCYWCHVMERESFTDPAVAERMNRDFVNIKVDREERPDLDEIYMAATQILTGHGGWPNSVFLTPALEPFFAGTYFPPRDRHGLPGFSTVLRSLAEAWRMRRGEVEEQATSVAQAMRHYLEERGAAGEAPPPAGVAERALADLERRFDAVHGGFGGAPKFPTPSNLLLLLEMADASELAGEMLATTLDRMARGGLFDQLGGGFHRYSTDGEWLVPHFEKMLYDNGYLLEIYAREWARAGDPEMARVARETAAWMAREMTAPGGALWSAQDAETEGREGAFYVWTREELEAVLGAEDFGFLAPIYGFDGEPNFEGSHYVLHLSRTLAAAAERRRLDREKLLAEIDPLRRRLLAARGERPRPLTDDKILADWNGIAIAGLATAGRLLDDRRLVEQAAAAAAAVLATLRGPDGVLLHAWRDGKGRVAAFLADYAEMIRGLLALDRATGEERWLAAAVELAGEMRRRLEDPDAGGFFAAAPSDDLLCRSKEIFDGATPGANALAVLDLVELGERTGDGDWWASAEAALACFAPLVEARPEAARTLALAARRFAQVTGRRSTAAAPVRGRLRLGPAGAGGARSFRVELEVADGWHLAAGAAPPGLALEAEGGPRLAAVELPAPELERPVATAEPVAVHRGAVAIDGRLADDGGDGAGGALLVHYQACDERRCLAPGALRLPLAEAAELAP